MINKVPQQMNNQWTGGDVLFYPKHISMILRTDSSILIDYKTMRPTLMYKM